jgi:citrate synthase
MMLDLTCDRIVGYCAHWRESLSDPDTKILRPQQDYRGVWLRHYDTQPGDRTAGHDQPAPLLPSNAYQRRVAGEMWQ